MGRLYPKAREIIDDELALLVIPNNLAKKIIIIIIRERVLLWVTRVNSGALQYNTHTLFSFTKEIFYSILTQISRINIVR